MEVSLIAEYVLKVLGAIGLAIVGWILADWLSKLVGNALARTDMDSQIASLTTRVLRWTILTLILLTAIALVGVKLDIPVAVIHVLGFALVVAFYRPLGNFAAGLMLMIYQPFTVGDTIAVAGQTGTVKRMDWFSTVMDTAGHRHIIIPNSIAFGSIVENMAQDSRCRADVDLGVAYSADIDRTRQVLEEAAKATPSRSEEPMPQVVLVGLATTSVHWQVRVWADRSVIDHVRQGAIREIKLALDRAHIAIVVETPASA